VIGQAAEFDYSGTQAVKALKEEGYRVILVNSNPATIMTDPELADRTYVEPVAPEWVARVIERERPDALLPTMGGQTALNVAMALAEDGTLDEFGVELIGADMRAIRLAEDRQEFADAMKRIGLAMPVGSVVGSLDEGYDVIDDVGYPAIIRPSFTLGGTGGGVAYNREEYEVRLRRALELSPVGTSLVERSVIGWKEYELEVMRDGKDNVVVVCSIENLDPMGVHTGDSITIAPAMTLTDREYQVMRDAAIAIIREIGVSAGGCNIQWRDAGYRDEPASVALLGTRIESHRFPHCSHRYQGRRRVHARRASQRHHQIHAGVIRAGARLCGGEVSQIRLREISRDRFQADDADEGRRGIDGDWADVQGGIPERPAST
jgi:carbamoyl-phosphate synthase large subunit